MEQKNISEVTEFIISALEQTAKDILLCNNSQNELLNACSGTLESLLSLVQVLNSEYERTLKGFELEKACKNQAYIFILENGFFDSYKEWSTKNPVEKFKDFHGVTGK